MMKMVNMLTSLSFLMAGSMAMAVSYKVDSAHSVVGFSVKHLVVSKVKGRFNKFDAGFDFDSKTNTVTKIDVTVDAASVDTNDKKRDDHLRSPDFFDVKKNPHMTFKADKVVVEKDKAVPVSGTLTIRGVSKPVTLNLTYGGSVLDPWGNEKVGFSLQGQINRKDFGVNWNKSLDKGGVMVSEDVNLEIEGEAGSAQAKK